MKIKVAVTSSRSEGFCNGSYVTVTAIIMFAVRLAVAQQVVFKTGRLPRVYNALISSDQRLLPSQADPIVSPVFRPLRFYYDWPTELVTLSSVETVVADASSEVLAVDVAGASEDDGLLSSYAAVKNNRPVDSSVPDVPPPPLPVTTGKKAKDKPEEYPPAPVGFAI